MISADGLTEADFRRYIAAFNRDDFDGFGSFYADNVVFEGRGRHFVSRDGVLAFYRIVKQRMRETITAREIIVGCDGIAAELEAELVALEDWPDFASGPVANGDVIRTLNFVWYEVSAGKFVHIRSARYQKLE